MKAQIKHQEFVILKSERTIGELHSKVLNTHLKIFEAKKEARQGEQNKKEIFLSGRTIHDKVTTNRLNRN